MRACSWRVAHHVLYDAALSSGSKQNSPIVLFILLTLLTTDWRGTLMSFLKYAEVYEAHRIAAVAWR